jgi:hypothetical protein
MVLLLAPLSAGAGDRTVATMYKRPYCGCCDGHADHLRSAGFDVRVVESKEEMTRINRTHRVPQELEGCHAIVIDGYVIEGHVPSNVIARLLKERPAIRGISLPGMPDGSPGMTGTKREPFTIYEIADGPPNVYAVE